MALTRKLLKGMSLTDEQVDTIIEAHTDTVNGLKDQIDEYKDDAEKLSKVEKELADAKKELAAAAKDDYKEKYETTLKEFEDYKESQAKEAAKRAKESAYQELLMETGIKSTRIDSVMKRSQSEIDKIELDKDGKIKGREKLQEEIKADWSEFIVTTEKQGAAVSTPPGNTGGSNITKEEIMAIPDRGKRVEAIAKNKDLFKGEKNNG